MATNSVSCSNEPGSEPARDRGPFPIRHVAEVVASPPEQQWLVEQLWFATGVGVLGGHPKLGKTFLAAQLAVAVASGTPALERFAAARSGPVLFYGPEDGLAALRNRFDALATVAGLVLKKLPIYLLDVAQLRLERPADLRRLRATIEQCRPRLLVLDPFVRLVGRVDENSAGDVSAVLGSLRCIQRDYQLALILVHHARKSPAAHPAQALRGSGDFAAWSDSNLVLTRRGPRLVLQIEHRHAPAPEPLDLHLRTEPAPHLALLDSACSPALTNPDRTDPLQSQLLGHLAAASRPLPTVELRQLVSRRKVQVIEALEQLRAGGRIDRQQHGWTLRQPDP